MRICRIALSYPTKSSPGAGLVAYYLCKYIKVPSLYLTIYRDNGEFLPNSTNFDLEAIKVPIEMSSNALNQSILKANFFQRLGVYTKITSGRSLKFLLNSIQKLWISNQILFVAIPILLYIMDYFIAFFCFAYSCNE